MSLRANSGDLAAPDLDVTILDHIACHGQDPAGKDTILERQIEHRLGDLLIAPGGGFGHGGLLRLG
jgi:hypothetical protein